MASVKSQKSTHVGEDVENIKCPSRSGSQSRVLQTFIRSAQLQPQGGVGRDTNALFGDFCTQILTAALFTVVTRGN